MKRAVAAAGCLAIAVAFAQQEQTSRSVWDGVFSDDQARRGQALYVEHCGSCHGDQMSGGEQAPALAGGEFLSNWNGLTLGDLFERIRITMPQDHPGRLSRQINADILAHMLAMNRFPSGKTELSTATEQLKQIRFEMSKPASKPEGKK